MLALAHTYITVNVTQRDEPYLIIGSMLPDIATVSGGIIPRDKIHNSPKEFYDFVNVNFAEYAGLGLGVMLHCANNRGADFHSDDRDTGYAYIHGRKITEDVAELLNRDADDISLIAAHNFIEGALDLAIAKDMPDILETYANARETCSKEKIAEILSSFVSLGYDEALEQVHKYMQFSAPENFSNRDRLVNDFSKPIAEIRAGIEIDVQKATEIIDKASEIIKDDYREFLDNTVEDMRSSFSNYI